MCGVAGALGPASADALQAPVRAMAKAIAHRGPDDEGFWFAPDGQLGLAHRRLSIIDLSPLGHQPMQSASGNLVTVFNGEIYNHADIRAELARAGAPVHEIRGGSDTAVMLAAVEFWGLEAALQRFVGMFVIALWDRRDQSLTIVRDRLGVKPLYWAISDGFFLFASEMAGLHAWPSFRKKVDRQQVVAFLQHSYVPAPHTIYANAHKLEPGCLLRVTAANATQPTIRAWWSLEQVVAAAQREPLLSLSDTGAVDAVESALRDSVRLRMVSDVPIGALLSGGIDSTAVVATMQSLADRPVHTFTIGYHERDFDEADHAAAVAAHLGTDHHEWRVSASEVQQWVPDLPTWFSEPFADSSQLPTLLVSKFARQNVTVALSGDGGDEFFGGYNRHLWGPRVWQHMRRAPAALRAPFGRAASSISDDVIASGWAKISKALPASMQLRLPLVKIRKLLALLPHPNIESLYFSLISWHQQPWDLVQGGKPRHFARRAPRYLNDMRFMMFEDTVGYLHDDILTKVDRASMAHGLEAREPLLDHRLLQLAWQLPDHFHIRNGVQKWALRQVVYRHVPAALVDRPKAGFGVPVGDWLRGPLRDWAAALLEPSVLNREGLLQAAPVTRLWQEHSRGTADHTYILWNILMLRAWSERCRPEISHD